MGFVWHNFGACVPFKNERIDWTIKSPDSDIITYSEILKILYTVVRLIIFSRSFCRTQAATGSVLLGIDDTLYFLGHETYDRFVFQKR